VLWVLVLAGGSGTRLGALTADARGMAVPKQFCSLTGGVTLLDATLARAGCVVPAERIVVVFAAEHERHWSRYLLRMPRENVVVQPRNRGTATGLLLGLAANQRRDRGAAVAVLPADQHVQHEDVLTETLAGALGAAARGDAESILLGMAPDEPVGDYGWIVPGAGRARIRPVAQFVEKPGAALASELHARGALWNSFVFTGRAETLVAMVESATGGAVRASALHEAMLLGHDALARLYDVLPDVDLSRAVFQRSPERLRVLAVPPCGWTDLGTPERVASCLASLDPHEVAAAVDAQEGAVPNLARRLRCQMVAHSA